MIFRPSGSCTNSSLCHGRMGDATTRLYRSHLSSAVGFTSLALSLDVHSRYPPLQLIPCLCSSLSFQSPQWLPFLVGGPTHSLFHPSRYPEHFHGLSFSANLSSHSPSLQIRLAQIALQGSLRRSLLSLIRRPSAMFWTNYFITHGSLGDALSRHARRPELSVRHAQRLGGKLTRRRHDYILGAHQTTSYERFVPIHWGGNRVTGSRNNDIVVSLLPVAASLLEATAYRQK